MDLDTHIYIVQIEKSYVRSSCPAQIERQTDIEYRCWIQVDRQMDKLIDR